MISGLDPIAIRAGATSVLKSALEAKSPAECEPAIGAAISGVTLTYVGKTGDTTHANDADRAKYSRSGYTAIFLPAAGICVLSAAVLCSRRKALTFK